jgi:hypothetical protein
MLLENLEASISQINNISAASTMTCVSGYVYRVVSREYKHHSKCYKPEKHEVVGRVTTIMKD